MQSWRPVSGDFVVQKCRTNQELGVRWKDSLAITDAAAAELGMRYT